MLVKSCTVYDPFEPNRLLTLLPIVREAWPDHFIYSLEEHLRGSSIYFKTKPNIEWVDYVSELIDLFLQGQALMTLNIESKVSIVAGPVGSESYALATKIVRGYDNGT